MAGSGALFLMRTVGKEAELANTKVALVSRVSHELKTPLSAIRGFAETLRDGALDDRPAAREALRRAVDLDPENEAWQEALKELEVGASSMEEVANRITQHLFDNAINPADNQPACALVRFYKAAMAVGVGGQFLVDVFCIGLQILNDEMRAGENVCVDTL